MHLKLQLKSFCIYTNVECHQKLCWICMKWLKAACSLRGAAHSCSWNPLMKPSAGGWEASCSSRGTDIRVGWSVCISVCQLGTGCHYTQSSPPVVFVLCQMSSLLSAPGGMGAPTLCCGPAKHCCAARGGGGCEAGISFLVPTDTRLHSWWVAAGEK